jgi:hypothetical protein
MWDNSAKICGIAEEMDMTLDLNKLFGRYEFEFESPTLGRLHCRSVSIGALTVLEATLADKNVTGRRFIVKLLTQVAERLSATEEQKLDAERKRTAVTEEEASKLTDEEIEAFSREFLAHNPELLQTYEGVKSEGRMNEKGQYVVSIASRPVELAKKPQERDSEYLARVYRRYLDEQNRRLKQMMPPLSGISQATQNLLRENFLLSDRLRGLGGALESAAARPLEKPSFRIPDIPPNPAYETNARLKDVIDYMGAFGGGLWGRC